MYCSFRSARAGKGERKQGSSAFQCMSPPHESGPQPDFPQRNSGHRLKGLWRKRLQETRIPAELEISIPQGALHCQVLSHVFPALIPFPRDKASAAQPLLSTRLWCLCHSQRAPFPHCHMFHLASDTFEDIQVFFWWPMGLNSTFAFQRTLGTGTEDYSIS